MSSLEPYKEEWLTGPQSTQFYTRTYTATKAVANLVFIHGFCEHVGRYTHIHPLYAQQGVNVFTFDQRGFGKTSLYDPKTNEMRSPKDPSTYAKTSWKEQMTDIEWAIQEIRKKFGTELPVFLMGHSMGGGLVLGFSTRPTAPPNKATLDLLSGVIATSPLIVLTKPPAKVTRWVGGKASAILPNQQIPAGVDPADLSHDPAFNEAYMKDPLIKQIGSLKGVNDMLSGGESVLAKDYKNWPPALPILLVHGTADGSTSPKATQELHDKLTVKDKKIILFEGGFHELQNEPDGVKEKMVEDVLTWIKAHIGSGAAEAANTSAREPEPAEPTATDAETISKL